MNSNKISNTIMCTRCGRNARYNHPARRPNGQIICEGCADTDTSGEILIGLNQNTLQPCGIYTKNTNVLWYTYSTCTNAWTNGGSVGYPIHDDEHNMLVGDLFAIMEAEQSEGKWRCTRCKQVFTKDDTQYPKLFAGRECAECREVTDKKIQKEREDGHVCMICGKPYSLCYC